METNIKLIFPAPSNIKTNFINIRFANILGHSKLYSLTPPTHLRTADLLDPSDNKASLNEKRALNFEFSEFKMKSIIKIFPQSFV